MEFQAIEPGIKVNGQTVLSIVDGFESLKKVAYEILQREGIGDDDGAGGITIDPAKWYSQEAWLRAFAAISKEVGEGTLQKIGTKIPENAVFPPWVQDVDSAIKAIDIAYHMNHQKGGVPMFDPDKGAMLEGIGHYGYERVEDEDEIVCECSNPYPCDFDIGIVKAMARKFEPLADVEHDDNKPCRKKGGESCTYIVTW